MPDKYSRWSFTTFSKKPVFRKMELVDLLVFQSENTKDGKLHYQGYIETYSPYSKTQIKALFSDRTMHVEPADKSRLSNIWYCTKPDSFAGYRYMYHACDCEYTHDEKDVQKDTTPKGSPRLSWKDILPKIQYEIF